jgi:peptide/nickel transport system permease protein
MTESALADPSSISITAEKRPESTLARITKYTLVRLVVLGLTVAVTVYVTILIANMGGYVDEIVRARIDVGLGMAIQGGWLREYTPEERAEIFAQAQQSAYEAAGLNQPFLLRTFRWLGAGLTLNWGETVLGLGFYYRQGPVRYIILNMLPRTLLLFGVANFLLFFITVFLALGLSGKYGSWLDRLTMGLTPLSAAPPWAYGVILMAISLKLRSFGLFGGTFDAWPTELRFSFILILLKHMSLPALAIFVSKFFQSVYLWRTVFMVYYEEDYVEMARAKGLPPRMLERRYLLRPALPNVVTGFALILVNLWQEMILLEMFFNVEGVGRLFGHAIQRFDTPLIVALVTVFAYLLAITVFVLDISYALLDPRVRVTGGSQTLRTAARGARWGFRLFARKGTPAGQRLPEPDRLRGDPARGRTAISLRGRVTPRRRVSPGEWLAGIRPVVAQVARSPMAVVGLIIVAGLVGVSIYTMITMPLDEAIALWRNEDQVWDRTPENALPVWVNLFRRNDLPTNLEMSSLDGTASKTRSFFSEDMDEIVITFPFEYRFEEFPRELVIYFDAEYVEKSPHVSVTWLTPDGREINITSMALPASAGIGYHFGQDERLLRRLRGVAPEQALFADPSSETPVPLQGNYELRISGLMFEEESDLDADFVLYGKVYGLAGTDPDRRDLMVALQWGTPIALAFGILAAISTSVATMLIAAVGSWFGGRVDGLIQRITEVNMILPFLPVSLMIYTMYSKRFWVILGVTVLLNIFGSGIKSYRAIFLQIKESPFIEAARAYGASNRRIIVRYMIPRIAAVLIPQLVILIPSYIFLEAALAFLGLSDPVLPTWGKLIYAALSYGLFTTSYHTVLIPAALLMLTGYAFAMIGFALERTLHPRLREI